MLTGLVPCAVKAEEQGKQGASAAAKGRTVFDEFTFWRCRFSNAAPVAHLPGGGLWPSKEFSIDGPPAEWIQPDFDDSGWVWTPGPFFNSDARCGFVMMEETSASLALMCLRKTFEVADPAAAGELKLNLHFRGGAVVYLNGKEIARNSLPDGDIDYATLADDYPKEAFLTPEGKVLLWAFGHPKKYKCYETRTRKIEGLKIPGALLRKGANVLAVEIHRAPFHEAVMFKNKNGTWELYGKENKPGRCYWTTAGIPRVELTAGGAGVTDPVKGGGWSAWNADPAMWVYETDLGPGEVEIRPIRIAGARNGKVAGQIVLASDKPIVGLKASVSDLVAEGGGATIAADAVRVFYPQANIPDKIGYRRVPRVRGRLKFLTFDTLREAPPETVPIPKRYREDCKLLALEAVQPVWVRVDVPADAKPGKYEGKLAVEGEPIGKLSVPIRLEVCDWTLAPSTNWRTMVDFFQSPEAVALRYDVPMWSDRHFELMERSFALLGSVGNKTVYINLVAKTDVGNSGTMLRWVKKGDGYEPDFTAVDRYLAMAKKYLGKPPVVCLYVWEQNLGGGYFGKKGWRKVKPLEVSVVDPATGQAETVAVSTYEKIEEAKAFWKPAAEGIRKRMAALGWSDSLMLGISDDDIPAKQIVELWHDLLPKAKWVSMSHARMSQIQGVPTGYVTTVWNAFWDRHYGWRDKELVAHFERDSWRAPGVTQLLRMGYLAGERNITAHQRGSGRMSGDLTWPALKDKRGRWHSISGRYPDSRKGQLNIRMNPFLAPGPNGAISTVRLEMIREGLQECEARIFIEDTLLDPARKARLGEELAGKCERVLEARLQAIKMAMGIDAPMGFCGLRRVERNAALFRLAGEVAAKLAEK